MNIDSNSLQIVIPMQKYKRESEMLPTILKFDARVIFHDSADSQLMTERLT